MEEKAGNSSHGDQDQRRGRLAIIIESIYRHRWLPISFASACLHAAMAMFVSSLAGEVDAMVVSFLRCILSAICALIAACYIGTRVTISTSGELRFHVVNAVFSGAAIYLQLYAYQHMAAAGAAAIVYSYIAFTGIFGRIFHKEAFSFFEITMVMLAVAGIVLITRPPLLFRSDSVPGIGSGVVPPLVALAASLANALYIVISRAMGIRDIETMKRIFYSMLFSAIAPIFPVLISGKPIIPPCTWSRVRALLMVICGFVGIALLNIEHALDIEDAVYVSRVSIDDVFIVFAVTVVFFGFDSKWTSIVGTLLIMGASFAILLWKVAALQRERTAGTCVPERGGMNDSFEPDHSEEVVSVAT